MPEKKYQIKLQGTAETQQWIAAQGVLRGLDADANRFIETLKAGVGIDLGGRIVNSLAQIPDLFGQAVKRGFDFNKNLNDSEIAISKVVQQFGGLDEAAGNKAASKAMADIVTLEPKVAGTVRTLVDGLLSTIAAAQSVGISLDDNIDLVGKFSNAMANAKIPAEQIAQEFNSILSGNITQDSRLAKILQINNADVKKAIAAGEIVEFLIRKIGKLGEAGDSAEVTFSTLVSAVDKATATLSKPLFDAIIKGAKELTTALADPAFSEPLKKLGVDLAKLASLGAGIVQFAIKNADGLLFMAKAAVEAGAAFAGIKLLAVLVGLARLAPAWLVQTGAISANTAALAANTGAQVANNAAKNVAGASAALTASAATAGANAGTALATSFGTKAGNIMRLTMSNLGVSVIAAVAGWELGRYLHDAIDENLRLPGDEFADEFAKPFRGKKIQISIGLAANSEELAAAKRDAQVEIDDMASDVKAFQEGNPTSEAQLAKLLRMKSELKIAQSYLRNADLNAGKLTKVKGADGKDEIITTEAQLKRLQKAHDELTLSLLKARAAAGEDAGALELLREEYRQLIKQFEDKTGVKIAVDVDKGTIEELAQFISKLSEVKGKDGKLLAPDDIELVQKAAEAFSKLADIRKRTVDDNAAKQKEEIDQAIKRLEIEGKIAELKGDTANATLKKAQADKIKLARELQESGLITDPKEAKRTAGVAVESDLANKNAKDDDKMQRLIEEENLGLDILRAKAAGREKEAEALEDQVKVLKEAARLQETLKQSADEAIKVATEKVRLEREAANAAKRTPQNDAFDLREARARARNPFKSPGGLEGLEALQKRSVLQQTPLDGFLTAGQRGDRERDILARLRNDEQTKRAARFPVTNAGAFAAGKPADAPVTPDGNNPAVGLQNIGNAVAAAGAAGWLGQIKAAVDRVNSLLSEKSQSESAAYQRLLNALRGSEQQLRAEISNIASRQSNDRS